MEPTATQVKQWEQAVFTIPGSMRASIACLAYTAGADAKLEACVDWMIENGYPFVGGEMKAALGRPKPPSLKQQALDALGPEIQPRPGRPDDELGGSPCLFMDNAGAVHAWKIIRRALESLPEEESC